MNLNHVILFQHKPQTAIFKCFNGPQQSSQNTYLSAGAQPNIRDISGKVPMDLAKRYSQDKVVAILHALSKNRTLILNGAPILISFGSPFNTSFNFRTI